MTLTDIIKQVRWCVDEESAYSDYEDTYFDNIVKAKIGAALRWCALYADAVLLNSGSNNSAASGLTKDKTIDMTDITQYKNGCVILPPNTVRVTRVRVSSWHKGVMKFVEEDSGEYLAQYDNTSPATVDRPLAAIIQTTPLKVELFPKPKSTDTVEISVILSPSDSDINTELGTQGTNPLSIPAKIETAFVYYLAHLVMMAHCDTTKANAMLEIAKQQIAITVK